MAVKNIDEVFKRFNCTVLRIILIKEKNTDNLYYYKKIKKAVTVH